MSPTVKECDVDATRPSKALLKPGAMESNPLATETTPSANDCIKPCKGEALL